MQHVHVGCVNVHLMNMTAMANVYAYVRISDDPKLLALGVGRQRDEVGAMCQRNNWHVVEWFEDNDISATSGAVRPAFERLMSMPPLPIVCWHSDRLVRLSKELERVLDFKADVYSLHSGQFDLSNPAGRAVARTITAWAQYEGEQKSIRQKAASAQRARMGKQSWPRRPFGFNFDATVNQPEAAALVDTYRNLLVGRPLARLAADLNGQGFRTSYGNQWRGPTLRLVLLNGRNAGLRVYLGDEVGPGSWDAIIDETTFRRAQRLLNNPERGAGGGGRRKSLLTGVATCGKCGQPVNRAYRGVTGSRVPYYRCLESHVQKPERELDRIMLNAAVARLVLPNGGRPATLAHGVTGEAPDVKAERARLEGVLDGYVIDLADGRISKRMYEVGVERIGVNLAALDCTEGADDSPLDGMWTPGEVAASLGGMDVDRQRAVIQWLFPAIRLHGRGRGKRIWLPGEVGLDVHEWDAAGDAIFLDLFDRQINVWARVQLPAPPADDPDDGERAAA